MNQYLKNLNKIEFVVTDACTGKCKHCSQGSHSLHSDRIDPILAEDAVRRVSAVYDIKTVMTFGGEPLLHTDAVYAIMRAAREAGVGKRQVITNAFFSRDIAKIREVVTNLYLVGVNDLLLSVDAFHQETIPLDVVRAFAREAMACGLKIRLQSAWLVSSTDSNPYNVRTRNILDSFRELGIDESVGNVIFPEGNALKFLSEYFVDSSPENPYIEDPCEVKCLSFGANGDVLDGNIYTKDVLEIIKDYVPKGKTNE